jgi:hypothetical protein
MPRCCGSIGLLLLDQFNGHDTKSDEGDASHVLAVKFLAEKEIGQYGGEECLQIEGDACLRGTGNATPEL